MAEGAPSPIIPPEGDLNMQSAGATPAEVSDEQAVLDAARQIVDGYAPEALKDAPAGEPLPERSFQDWEGLAAATDSAMREGTGQILQDTAREGMEALAPRIKEMGDKAMEPYRREAAARARRQIIQDTRAKRSRPSGLLGQPGAASKFSRYRQANQTRPLPESSEQPGST